MVPPGTTWQHQEAQHGPQKDSRGWARKRGQLAGAHVCKVQPNDELVWNWNKVATLWKKAETNQNIEKTSMCRSRTSIGPKCISVGWRCRRRATQWQPGTRASSIRSGGAQSVSKIYSRWYQERAKLVATEGGESGIEWVLWARSGRGTPGRIQGGGRAVVRISRGRVRSRAAERLGGGEKQKHRWEERMQVLQRRREPRE
ncbi:unnamed protein product [Calypogeia fissa]